MYTEEDCGEGLVNDDNESKDCQQGSKLASHPCIPGEEPAPGSGFVTVGDLGDKN